MKKLLLLALTVTAAASLTACGSSSVKEIDTLMGNLVSTDDFDANYSVDVRLNNSYTYYGQFNVDGNKIELISGSHTSTSGDGYENYFYEVTGETTFNYFNKGTSNGETVYTKYAMGESLPTNSNTTSVNYADTGYRTIASYYVGLAYASPFAALETAVQEDSTNTKFEVKSKYFSFDKEEETYFFVNPEDESADQKTTTVKTSLMTVKFLYEDETNKKLLTSVEVVYDGMLYTYTNLDNSEESTEITPVVLPTTEEDNSAA
ncbi:MAG: hypothetical protein R3Y60_03905 [bacterium]